MSCINFSEVWLQRYNVYILLGYIAEDNYLENYQDCMSISKSICNHKEVYSQTRLIIAANVTKFLYLHNHK